MIVERITNQAILSLIAGFILVRMKTHGGRGEQQGVLRAAVALSRLF